MRGLGALLAYLIGAIPVGLLVARAVGGVDIRRRGSGNIGATNVLRTLGPLPGIVTLLGDVAKGYGAVTVAGWLGAGSAWAALGALLAVVGNCWSVFLGLHGGKGVATGLGAFLALAPWAIAPSAVVWIALAASFRYVSLASVLACLGLPVGVALLGYPWQCRCCRRGGGHHRPAAPREPGTPDERHGAEVRRAGTLGMSGGRA